MRAPYASRGGAHIFLVEKDVFPPALGGAARLAIVTLMIAFEYALL
jgi:hypothetical protein